MREWRHLRNRGLVALTVALLFGCGADGVSQGLGQASDTGPKADPGTDGSDGADVVETPDASEAIDTTEPVNDPGAPPTDASEPNPDASEPIEDTGPIDPDIPPEDVDEPDIDELDSEEPDVGEPDIEEPDVGEPDVGVPDAGPTSCSSEDPTCLDAPSGTPDVTIEQKTGVPAALTGGSAPSGDYELTLVEVYPESMNGGMPIPLITLTVKSNGDTHGAVRFDEAQDAWALAANLDLQISVSLPPIVNETLPFTQLVGGGGCYTVSGKTIYGDLLECFDGPKPLVDLPTAFEYETDGDLKLLVAIDKEVVLAAIPPDLAGLAAGFITDDLELLLYFGSL